MAMSAEPDAGGGLLAEQLRYYRAVAEHYHEGRLDALGGDELAAALDAFAPTGDVLELACGPGTWTPQLLGHAATVTALDASPEMLALARERVAPDLDRVRFVQADLFCWLPDRRYDVVFMGFWISHVPRDRFAEFWSRVDQGVAAGGRVMFVDDAHRSADELIEGEASSTIQRRLRDGTPHRLVKMAHTPERLERELAALGWNIQVQRTAGPFYWGMGARATS